MERDALLAHGTSFLLQDRLMNCSDYSTAHVCRRCGSLITLGFEQTPSTGDEQKEGVPYCRVCDGDEGAVVDVEAGGQEVANGGESVRVGGVIGKKEGKVGRNGKGMDVIAIPCECPSRGLRRCLC